MAKASGWPGNGEIGADLDAARAVDIHAHGARDRVGRDTRGPDDGGGVDGLELVGLFLVRDDDESPP